MAHSQREPERLEELIEEFERIGLHPEIFDNDGGEIQYIQHALKRSYSFSFPV